MKTVRLAGNKLVRGFVVMAFVVAPLVLVSIVSMGASPQEVKVQPEPVPTPPPVQAVAVDASAGAVAKASAAVAPSPKPVSMPPGSQVIPQGQASWATLSLFLGLSTFATVGLFFLRLVANLAAGNVMSGMRQAPTACQEC